MKNFLSPILLVAAAISTSCAAPHTPLALGMVGPAPAVQPPAAHAPYGTLLVFSAYETSSLGASPFDDIRPHTAYEIYDSSGGSQKKISNQTGAFGEDPAAVQLVPGVYRIVAKSNGYGAVALPVRIEADKITSVHLDSEAPKSSNQGSAVKLPDGQVVGWSANG